MRQEEKKDDRSELTGLVVRTHGKICYIEGDDGRIYMAYIRGKFRIEGLRDMAPVAVGDRVTFTLKGNVAVISYLHERKNHIVREDPVTRRRITTAANIDLFLPVYTLKEPYTPLIFLDKLLITAEAYDITSIILINKIDTYTDEEMERARYIADIYGTAGYECIFISALKGINLDVLREKMKGKISVFMGLSGCGKSTLINALVPGVNVRTSEVSRKSGLGRHTTTYAALYKMDKDTYIADTAGIRIFKMSDIEKWELSHYYPEMRRLMHQCKFNNCTHTHEDDCAVKRAVEEGLIHKTRYDNYVLLLEGETISNPYE